jgi:hypothetical protein
MGGEGRRKKRKKARVREDNEMIVEEWGMNEKVDERVEGKGKCVANTDDIRVK